MKIALIADTHFGNRKNSDIFLDSSFNFFKNEFKPYLEKNGISTICFLGDLYDNQHQINVKVKNVVYNLFNDVLSDFKIYLLVGNHDRYYKDDIKINSLKFFNKFDNITVIEDIELIKIDNRDILMIPWQSDNAVFKNRVANKNLFCDVCLGHFEISGHKFNRYKICDYGLESDLFYNNYNTTFSGHFHTRSISKRKNSKIIYIGTPYELNRHDINDTKGFCVLDLKTMEYEFIDTTNTIKYIELEYPEEIKKATIKGNIIDVNVLVNTEYNEKEFGKYIDKINSYAPIEEINIKYLSVINDIIDIEKMNTKTTEDIIIEYVNQLDDIDDKNEILEKIMNLFEQC